MAWLECIDRRGRSSRTYQDSETGKFALESICGTPLHYESVPDSGVFDAVIDCTPQRVKTAALDGWRITQNSFHYALGKPAGKSDGWVGFGGRQGAHWFSFRLARVGYLHWPTRAWQDIGGNPTYDRANLTIEVNRTAPMADGAELTVSSIARWSNIWQTPDGGALDLSWRVDGAHLKEEVTINAAGRAWIAANRKPTTKARETWFGFVFQLDWSDVPRVVRQSVLQSIDGDFADDGLPLELRDAADRLLGFLPVDDLIVRNGEEELGRTPLQKRFWRDGDGNHYLLVGVRCNLLADLPAGDLVFDPTITLQPDATAGADTHINSAYPNNNYGTSITANVGRVSGTTLYRFLLKFDLSSLPDSAILNSSILTLYQQYADIPNTIEIFRSKRAWVESQATWNVYATGNSWQEAGGFGADDCDTTVIGSRAFTEPDSSGYLDFVLTPTTKADLDFGNGWLLKAADEVWTYTYCLFYTSNGSTAAYRPKLVIEYTEGGGGTDALTANGITTGTPTLGSPTLGQVHALTGTAITATTPVLGHPVIGQVHILTTAGIIAGAPDLGTPAIGQVHVLTATAIATGAPAVGSPTVGQAHILTAAGIVAGAPLLGAAAIGQLHALAAVAITASSPVLGSPIIGQIHALTGTAITAGQPALDTPAIGQVHALTASGIVTGTPEAGQPVIGLVHVLVAALLLAGAPVLGAPRLFLMQIFSQEMMV